MRRQQQQTPSRRRPAWNSYLTDGAQYRLNEHQQLQRQLQQLSTAHFSSRSPLSIPHPQQRQTPATTTPSRYSNNINDARYTAEDTSVASVSSTPASAFAAGRERPGSSDSVRRRKAGVSVSFKLDHDEPKLDRSQKVNLQGELAVLERMLFELEAETATLNQEEDLKEAPRVPGHHELQRGGSSSNQEEEAQYAYENREDQQYQYDDDDDDDEEQRERGVGEVYGNDDGDSESEDGGEEEEFAARREHNVNRSSQTEKLGNAVDSHTEEDDASSLEAKQLSQVCYKSLSIGMHLARKMDQLSRELDNERKIRQDHELKIEVLEQEVRSTRAKCNYLDVKYQSVLSQVDDMREALIATEEAVHRLTKQAFEKSHRPKSSSHRQPPTTPNTPKAAKAATATGMAAYVPPDWGVDGANAFGIYVEVIKSGVVVENMKLPTDPHKSCVVAGRMEPLCDLVLQHPSISRVHAALQFDKHGALFLRDLESTHGTFLNKKRIPANDFVRLHIGDVVVFGESTRLYAVCGPPELLPQEYDSLNLQKFREKSGQRQEKKATQRKSSGRNGGRAEGDDDSGASWGFGEDAAEEDDEDDGEEDTNEEGHKDEDNLPDYLRNLKEDETPYKSSLKQSEINDKDKKLFQQLQTRIKKMENLKLEKSRIQAKQNQLTGLTDGQEKTLERNEQRIQALKKEIEDIEERIHAKNAQREKTKSGASAAGGAAGVTLKKKQSVNESLYGYESDEDDFYDRTKSNQRKLLERKQQLGVSEPSVAPAAIGAKKIQSEVLTAESIQAKIKALERELSELATEYEEEQTRASRDVVQEQKQEDEELDSLDSFMASTTRELHSTQLSSIQSRKQGVEAELRRQRQLLVVATPALAHVPAQTRAESKSTPEPESSQRKPVVEPPSLSQPQKEREVAKEPVASKAKQPEAGSKSPIVPSKKPAEPRERDPAETDEASEETKPRKSSSPTTTTRAEAPPAKTDSVQTKKRRVVGPARPQVVTAKRKDDVTGFANETSTLEGGDRVWVPPTNQTGDGRTKLNDKYGY